MAVKLYQRTEKKKAVMIVHGMRTPQTPAILAAPPKRNKVIKINRGNQKVKCIGRSLGGKAMTE